MLTTISVLVPRYCVLSQGLDWDVGILSHNIYQNIYGTQNLDRQAVMLPGDGKRASAAVPVAMH